MPSDERMPWERDADWWRGSRPVLDDADDRAIRLRRSVVLGRRAFAELAHAARRAIPAAQAFAAVLDGAEPEEEPNAE